ncbi:hypothetical protein E4T50_00786 [Aureobasidium sp. EXF-12298]|nr:hypothetical protein E4T50_00786 [Aureobasidium sp. EXF-12298]KAI4760528.1 hypothetical protein E4T51_06468 [Aureobasidium sp. EXF-12344]KAI4782330.1 hypothetical protein E4T52_02737 [Aureobasidium sp. EXF-3400]
MSDNESTNGESPVKADKKAVVFTEKEEMVLKAAWRCLKSGPPEIDMEKLMRAAGFNTMKTTSNTWGVIKKKLFSDVDGDSLPTAPTKPKAPAKGKKAAATPTPSKKRGKKDVEDEDGDEDDEGRTLVNKRKKIVKTEDSDDD